VRIKKTAKKNQVEFCYDVGTDGVTPFRSGNKFAGKIVEAAGIEIASAVELFFAVVRGAA